MLRTARLGRSGAAARFGTHVLRFRCAPVIGAVKQGSVASRSSRVMPTRRPSSTVAVDNHARLWMSRGMLVEDALRHVDGLHSVSPYVQVRARCGRHASALGAPRRRTHAELLNVGRNSYALIPTDVCAFAHAGIRRPSNSSFHVERGRSTSRDALCPDSSVRCPRVPPGRPRSAMFHVERATKARRSRI